MAIIAGSIDRIVFRNPESGFCVARFRLVEHSRGGQAVVTAVGTMPTVQAGEMLRLIGDWQVHPVHGRNFRVEQFEPELPSTVDGIERYLASGVISGVGPVTAARIVEAFGDQSISVIDEQPELLRRVAGISSRRLQVIKESWEEQKRIRELMMFLQGHGISVALAARIYQSYGADAVEVISRDPYQLAHDIHGIGFRTADSVARQLGIPKHSASRYVAGLKFTLSQATDDGHVFLTRTDLLNRAARLLEASIENLEPAMLELLRRGDAVVDGESV
jgi:exodeoxyribonuclease V alpha subunit